MVEVGYARLDLRVQISSVARELSPSCQETKIPSRSYAATHSKQGSYFEFKAFWFGIISSSYHPHVILISSSDLTLPPPRAKGEPTSL